MTTTMSKVKVRFLKDFDNVKEGQETLVKEGEMTTELLDKGIIELVRDTSEPQQYIHNTIAQSVPNNIVNTLYDRSLPIQQFIDNEGLRFCKIKKQTKKPFEKDWVNKPYNYSEIKEHIDKEVNYGVLCGYGGLIVIDSDEPELREAVSLNLPPTFRVRTGSGGTHDYYFCEEAKKKIVLERNKHFGEVQSQGTQVVGPNSLHPTGNYYQVAANLAIAKISYEQLLVCIKPFMKEIQVFENKTIKELRDYGESDINNISITSVISGSFKQGSRGELYGANPWHGSSTGMNFWINPTKNVAHCFRCNVGINVAKAIAITEGIAQSCSDHLTKQDFLKVLEVAQQKYGLKKQSRTEFDFSKIVSELKDIRLQVYELLTKEDSNSKRMATEIICKSILAREHIYTTRQDEREEVWIYKDGIYIPQGKTYIKQFSRTVLSHLYTSHLANEIIAKIETDTYVDPDKFFKESNISEIPVANGILNIFTAEIMPFTPSKIFFNKIPITFDTGAKCPNIEKFFSEVLKSDEEKRILEELFGYCLLKDYRIEKAFMFVGSGRNGKSKTIELLKRFVGPENCANIPIQQFEADKFSMSQLHGKFVNISGDLSPEALSDTSNFKTLTGTDLISANRKFLTPINFVNYSKQVYSANNLPKTYDLTPAFFNRWVIMEFPYTFLSPKELEFITNTEERQRSKLADKEIIEKITSAEELSGMLNLALLGLNRLLQQRDFSYSQSIKEVKNLWIRKSDSFQAFCMDFLQQDYNSCVTKATLRHAYTQYCMKHRLASSGDKAIKETLTRDFGAVEDRRSIVGTQEHVWVGIKLKESEA